MILSQTNAVLDCEQELQSVFYPFSVSSLVNAAPEILKANPFSSFLSFYVKMQMIGEEKCRKPISRYLWGSRLNREVEAFLKYTAKLRSNKFEGTNHFHPLLPKTVKARPFFIPIPVDRGTHF